MKNKLIILLLFCSFGLMAAVPCSYTAAVLKDNNGTVLGRAMYSGDNGRFGFILEDQQSTPVPMEIDGGLSFKGTDNNGLYWSGSNCTGTAYILDNKALLRYQSTVIQSTNKVYLADTGSSSSITYNSITSASSGNCSNTTNTATLSTASEVADMDNYTAPFKIE